MNTQPRFPTPGTHPPPRSPRFPRNHRHLPVRGEPARSPRRACPEPVEGAVSNHPWDAATKPILTPPSRHLQPGPSSNQHPRPTAVRRQSAPPNPPSPRLPTRPSHLVRTAPSPAPNWPKSAPPRPQEFFGKNSYTRTTPRRPRPEPSSTRPSVIPASSAGTQRQPASQGLRATPSIPRPQPHRLVRPAQLTDHPSVPPDAEDSPIRRKKPPQAISGQPVPSGDRLARDSSSPSPPGRRRSASAPDRYTHTSKSEGPRRIC